MVLTNEQIIAEADILVPNGYVTPDKIPWLNALNQEFFDVVKIPASEFFAAVAGTKTYTLSGNIKEKNIDKVMVGPSRYRSLNYEDVQPAQNWFLFNEPTHVLTLSSAPLRSATGVARYARSSLTTFTQDGVAAQAPDAPSEYHWIIVLGLAEYIAKANEEDEKAANYGGQYRNALQVAAQNFQKAGAT